MTHTEKSEAFELICAFVKRCFAGDLVVLKKKDAVCPVCGYEFESVLKFLFEKNERPEE